MSILDTPEQNCGITDCLGEGGISQSCFGTEIAQMKFKNDVFGVFSVFIHDVKPFSKYTVNTSEYTANLSDVF